MCWSETFKNLSILLAAWSVIYGIGAWRREFIGKRKIELAEEVLALFYEAKDAVHTIRSPFGFEGEGSTRKPGKYERPEDKETLDNAYVVIERYNKYQAPFNKLYAMRYRFMAQVGKDEAKPFDELRDIINEIILASRRLARLWIPKNLNALPPEQLEKYQKGIEETEAIFWEKSVDPDPINPRLEEVITKMEKICRSIIETPNSLYGFLNYPLSRKKTKG